MIEPVARKLFVWALAVFVMAVAAYAARAQSSPTVTFRGGILPSEIQLCFRGVPKEPLAYIGDKVVEWEYRLPVVLTITNIVKGSRAKRTYRFNLKQSGRTLRSSAYKIKIVYGIQPCVDVEVINPFLGSRDARRTGRLTLRVATDGEFLGQATYAYTIRVQGQRQIWEGTDAFINYCIGEGKRIWSSGGKLYCWRDAEALISVRRVG